MLIQYLVPGSGTSVNMHINTPLYSRTMTHAYVYLEYTCIYIYIYIHLIVFVARLDCLCNACLHVLYCVVIQTLLLHAVAVLISESLTPVVSSRVLGLRRGHCLAGRVGHLFGGSAHPPVHLSQELSSPVTPACWLHEEDSEVLK